MGYVLIDYGLELDLDKIEVVIDLLIFQNVEDVQYLNGFIIYFSKFIFKFVDVMESIRWFIRKDVEWNWLEE